jgi:hypothetical protein
MMKKQFVFWLVIVLSAWMVAGALYLAAIHTAGEVIGH